jgi:metal-responsive CopG/Arc/MetJ family transcriptional regulator
MQNLHAKLLLYPTGVLIMSKLVRIVVQLPVELKEQLDALKQQGYTTSGFIRATLERELNKLDVRQDSTTRKAVTK